MRLQEWFALLMGYLLKDYRKFKIKTVEGPDDYGSMKEVIYRRYYRVLVEGLKTRLDYC